MTPGTNNVGGIGQLDAKRRSQAGCTIAVVELQYNVVVYTVGRETRDCT